LTEIHGKGSNGDNVFWSATVYIVVTARVGPSRRAQPPTPLHRWLQGSMKTPTTPPHAAIYYIIVTLYARTDCSGERDYEGRTSTSGVISAARWSCSGKMAGSRTTISRALPKHKTQLNITSDLTSLRTLSFQRSCVHQTALLSCLKRVKEHFEIFFKRLLYRGYVS